MPHHHKVVRPTEPRLYPLPTALRGPSCKCSVSCPSRQTTLTYLGVYRNMRKEVVNLNEFRCNVLFSTQVVVALDCYVTLRILASMPYLVQAYTYVSLTISHLQEQSVILVTQSCPCHGHTCPRCHSVPCSESPSIKIRTRYVVCTAPGCG